SPSGREVTKCSELLASGWQPPPDAVPDFSWDSESGIIQVYVGDETLVLDVHRDKDCQSLPILGPLIVRGLADESLY
ncbi:hypothetical protein, partial [Nocardioides sp. GCM10030258]|uniref:hypothetical protein n=1 Tax=unclassified Nocardioides TaxID=2615069 RepID=UPI00361671A3